MKKIAPRLAAAGIASGSLLVALPVWAANLPSIVPECATKKGPPPGLDCVLVAFGNIANLATMIIGALVLLMFVYGGFKVIYSSGNSSKAQEGLSILRNAVIGMVIVLLAGYIVEYGLAQMKITAPGTACFVQGTNKAGKMVETKSGPKCAASCDTIKEQGYSCQNIKTIADPGSCIQYLCPTSKSTDIQCCLNSTPTTSTTPAAPAP